VDTSALLLSRIQFAFTVSFHIIFPAFTIGLAAWLAFLEACSLVFKKPVYRRLFDFWLRIFAIAFGLGVVSGIVMAFEFGTNWSELAAAPDRSRGHCSATRASPPSRSRRRSSVSLSSAAIECRDSSICSPA
jgi:Cytochrome bd terminal oxidase subunit I